MPRKTTRLLRFFSGARGPIAASQGVVLLGVDFHVIAARADEMNRDVALDHLLQQQDEIGLLEALRVAPGSFGVIATNAMVMLAKKLRAARGETGDADVFSAGVIGGDVTMNL